MPLPSLPGGTAAKVADLYEVAWTVDSLLDLLAGKVRELHLEPQSEDGLGVEFYRVLSSGEREYYSVKRQAPGSSSAWTPYQLTRRDPKSERGVLDDLFGHLDRSATARVVFVSQDSAGAIRELAERAKAAPSADDFVGLLSNDHQADFEKLVKSLARDPADIYQKLRQCEFTSVGHHQLVRLVEARIPALVQCADGAPADSAEVRRILSEFAWRQLTQTVTANDVLNELKQCGFAEQRLAASAQVRGLITDHNAAYMSRMQSALINGAQIPRDQATVIVDALTARSESLLLAGRAGEGKSCIVAQVLEKLASAGIPHLALSMDELNGVISSADLGRRMDLSASPAIVLGQLSAGEPAVLCIDQLDALSVVSGRNVQGRRLLEELLQQASRYPKLRVLLACRSFDLEHDDVLRGLVNGESATARRVDVDLLSDNDVHGALAMAGFSNLSLSESQVELLRTPLHLYLFLGGGAPAEDFGSRRDLFDRYWNEKRRRVEGVTGNGSFAGAVERLSTVLSDRRQLQASRTLLTSHEAALDAMASESVVLFDRSRVAFFHASFFDYAFARCFVSRGQDLVDWLKGGGQDLFRRSQVRQILEFLRDDDTNIYMETLSWLLGDHSVRFHLKRLTLDWLGQLSDPREAEWTLLKEQDERIQGHVLGSIRNREPWFDLLDRLGVFHTWLKSGQEQDRDRAIFLLRAPAAFKRRSARVAKLLRTLLGRSDTDRLHLRAVMSWGDAFHSREMMDLFLELVDDGTLDDVRGFGMNADWWLLLYSMSTSCPEYCAEAIGHWLDRQYVLSERPGHSGFDEPDRWSQFSEGVIERVASAAPLAFARELLPRVTRAAAGPNERRWEHAIGGAHGEILEGLSTALRNLAADDPKILDTLLGGLPPDPPLVIDCLKLDAWSANPGHYADQILRHLISRHELLSASNVESAVRAATPLGNRELTTELERLALGYTPKTEKGTLYGFSQYCLLVNFAPEALSERGAKRLEELRRKFGEDPPATAPLVPKVEMSAVPPRVPDDATARMTDDQWIHAMQTVHVRPGSGSLDPDWDEVTLARQLEARAKIEPMRFAHLACDQMPSDLPPRYFGAILDALAGSEQGDQPLETVLRVIRRMHDLPGRPCGLSIGRAVRAIARQKVPPDVIAAVAFYAIHDPDPSDDKDPNDGSDDDTIDPVVTAGINSVRGVAAEAIAALLFADRGRLVLLGSAVDALVRDPSLAVRSIAVRAVLAILRDDEARSLELFSVLCTDAESVLGSRYFEEYLNHAIYRSYQAVRPILLQMLDSQKRNARRAAARQICLATLHDGPSRESAMEDATRVQDGDVEARTAAAQVYAANCGHPDVAEQCIEKLLRFFDDPEEVVRKAAAHCFRQIEAERLAEEDALIEAFSASAAFVDNPSPLLFQLEDMSGLLPPSICSLAHRAVDAWGAAAGDVQTALAVDASTLSKLVVRFYAQTEDGVHREEALDAIDQMIESGFLGIDDELAALDRA